MGEKGVNLTGTAYARPSLFEIIAQESLSSILEPAFSKLVTVRLCSSYVYSPHFWYKHFKI